MRFELIASANISPTGGLLAATFHEGVLNILKRAWRSTCKRIQNTGNRLFTLAVGESFHRRR